MPGHRGNDSYMIYHFYWYAEFAGECLRNVKRVNISSNFGYTHTIQEDRRKLYSILSDYQIRGGETRGRSTHLKQKSKN